MKPADFDIQKVVDYLQGTTNTLDDAIETLYPGMDWIDFDEEDHNKLDNEIFLCPVCGWWCEISQMSTNTNDMGEDSCSDCVPDNDEE